MNDIPDVYWFEPKLGSLAALQPGRLLAQIRRRLLKSTGMH